MKTEQIADYFREQKEVGTLHFMRPLNEIQSNSLISSNHESKFAHEYINLSFSPEYVARGYKYTCHTKSVLQYHFQNSG